MSSDDSKHRARRAAVRPCRDGGYDPATRAARHVQRSCAPCAGSRWARSTTTSTTSPSARAVAMSVIVSGRDAAHDRAARARWPLRARRGDRRRGHLLRRHRDHELRDRHRRDPHRLHGGLRVRKGAGGRGGRRFQILAVVLTYWAVGLAYTPLAFKGIDAGQGVGHRRISVRTRHVRRRRQPSAERRRTRRRRGTLRRRPAARLVLALGAAVRSHLRAAGAVDRRIDAGGLISALIIFIGTAAGVDDDRARTSSRSPVHTRSVRGSSAGAG